MGPEQVLGSEQAAALVSLREGSGLGVSALWNWQDLQEAVEQKVVGTAYKGRGMGPAALRQMLQPWEKAAKPKVPLSGRGPTVEVAGILLHPGTVLVNGICEVLDGKKDGRMGDIAGSLAL
eukprot:gene5790-6071_t